MDEKVHNILINKPASKENLDLLKKYEVSDDPFLFIIVSDLSLKRKYTETLIAVSAKRYVVIDPGYRDGAHVGEIASIKSAYVKRMYGNAQLYVETEDSKEAILRFTYAIASLCEMAAMYLKHVGSGQDVALELEVVEATYEKLMNVCPKCGRTLIHAGAECIACRSKTKIFKRLYGYIKPYKATLLFCIVLSLVGTAFHLIPPYATGLLVDKVFPNKNVKMLTIIVVALVCSYILEYSIGALRGYLLRICGDKTVKAIRNDVYEKAQHLPMKFYDKTSTGSVINRISSDTATIQAFMLRVTQEVIVQFFILIGIVIIMLVLNWKLTLLSLIPVPVVVVGAKIFSKKIAPFYRRIWKRSSRITSVLTDTIPNIRVIKSFAGEKRAVDRFAVQNEDWFRVDRQAGKIACTFPWIVSFLIQCGSLLIWGIGGSWVINTPDAFSAGLLVSFISYVAMFYGPVNFFANLSDSYQHALASIERIFDIIEAEPEQDFGAVEMKQNVAGKIEFRNVNFSFDRTKKVLSDINVVIEPGDIVGIVGTTGSGKSTLINLLLRYYDNYEGEILLDGVDIKSYKLESYRSHIGYVQQEPMMFSDTIFNNIAYGKPDAHVEEVIHAAEIANAHEFIARQPDGYDSMLGERGVGLSGGERQRVSIARAVLTNPSILVFDEATAAVDSETEHLIQDAIEKLISGRTTLMIAHRLSTLRKANKIIVVDQGKIIEFGSPEELMALKGKYYKLIEIQSMSGKGIVSWEEDI